MTFIDQQSEKKKVFIRTNRQKCRNNVRFSPDLCVCVHLYTYSIFSWSSHTPQQLFPPPQFASAPLSRCLSVGCVKLFFLSLYLCLPKKYDLEFSFFFLSLLGSSLSKLYISHHQNIFFSWRDDEGEIKSNLYKSCLYATYKRLSLSLSPTLLFLSLSLVETI